MTILMQRMREELVRRTYSETPIRSYLHAVEAFREHVQKGFIIRDLRIFAVPEQSIPPASPVPNG